MVMTATENIDDLPGSTKSCFAKDENPEQIATIERLFSEGYKLFLAKEFEDASDKLGEANQLAVALYGQFAPECFKPHYYYGLTLIEIARNEALIVNAPGGEQTVDEEDDEDEKETEAEVDEKKPVNDDDVTVGSTAESRDAPSGEQSENPTFSKAGGTNESEEPKATDDQEESLESGDEEEVSTEMLAWESLEVARKICEKNGGPDKDDWMDKQIDVLIALGDCMVISEEYEAAMRDFNTALELHKKYYGENNRRTAEILYNIACCHRNIDDFKKAAEYFEEASKIITNILNEMEKIENPTAEDREKSASLKKVVEDVQYNAQDARDSDVIWEKKIEENKEMLKSVFTSLLSDKPINEITTLVRKSVKRPAADNSKDDVGAKSAEHSGDATEKQKDDAVPTADISTVKKTKVDE